MQTLYILYYYFKAKYLYHFKSRESLEHHQGLAYAFFKRNTLKHSNYYSSHYNNELHQLPLMNKHIMMESFDVQNTVNMDKATLLSIALQAEDSRDFSPTLRDITVGLSSGTSGNRGLFIASKKERLKWAGYLLAKVLPTSIFSRCKIAFFLRANSNLYSTINKSKRIKLQFFDLQNDLDNYIEVLNKYQPDMLVAPPRALLYLAQKQHSGELTIYPKKIVSVAEVLEDSIQDILRAYFNVNVIHQIYQCTEGFLGTTCEHGTLHINEEWIFVEKEWIDHEKTRFIPIITDLERSSQPIVRYRLDDILTIKTEPCFCGAPNLAIEKIEGRCNEILYFHSKDGKQIRSVFPDFISQAILNASLNIHNYQVEQSSFQTLTIALEDFKNIDIQNSIKNNFVALFEKLEIQLPELIFTSLDSLNFMTKFKRIKSHIKMGEKYE